MTTRWKSAMVERIRQHGEQLLKIFPLAFTTDPVALCKKLRRLELQAHKLTTLACNEPVDQDAHDAKLASILAKVDDVLCNVGKSRVPVLVNRDPRGYALKIDSDWLMGRDYRIHTDMGGYGIIAPDLSEGD